MRDDYTYTDPDNIYRDPQSGVLINLAGIDDKKALEFFESAAVAKRIKELRDKPLKIKNSASLLAIHKYLFQDVYQWAGMKRLVEIRKGGNPFFPTERFGSAFAYIDGLLDEYRKITKTNKKEIAKKLAVILDAVNYLHPFREGNGRTQREFVRVLALEKNFELNLNPADNTDVYKRYMAGTIGGNTDDLSELILGIMNEIGIDRGEAPEQLIISLQEKE